MTTPPFLTRPMIGLLALALLGLGPLAAGALAQGPRPPRPTPCGPERGALQRPRAGRVRRRPPPRRGQRPRRGEPAAGRSALLTGDGGAGRALRRGRGNAHSRVIVYGSGGEAVDASVTYFALRLLGFEDVAVYPAGWVEWSRYPDQPRE